MNQRVYEWLSPQPELRPTSEKIKGLYGPNHSPLGECTVKMEIPELAIAIHYDGIVDDIEEDFLIDVSMLHNALQIKYDTELYRKRKAVNGVARIRRGEYRA